MKNENEEWNKLCDLVANESDPQRLSRHLDQLIQALDDARKQALHRAAKEVKPASSSTDDVK